MEKENAELSSKWEGEKANIDTLKDLKQKISNAHTEFEEAQRKGDLELAARLKYGTIAELEKELQAKEEALVAANGNKTIHQ